MAQTQLSEGVREWLDAIVESSTRTKYEEIITTRLGFDFERFLETCRTEKQEAESFFVHYLAQTRQNYAPATVRLRYAIVKSCLEYQDIHLNWMKIRKALPKLGPPNTRALTLPEIRKIFEVADTRAKFILSLLASSGVRSGAFDFFQVGDLEPREDYGILTVYRGEPEKYQTFVSKECVQLFEAYLKERVDWGETITPASPLVRNRVSHVEEDQRLRPITSGNLRNWLGEQWRNHKIKADFPQSHGFRKFYKTNMENAGMKTLFVEMLLGHKTGLHGNYMNSMEILPQLNKLAEEYQKFQSVLWISEALTAKTEVKKLESNVNARMQKLESDNADLRRQNQLAVQMMMAVMEKSGNNDVFKEIAQKLGVIGDQSKSS